MLQAKDLRTSVPTHYGDWVAKFGEAWKRQTDQLKQRFGSSIEEIRMPGTFSTDVPIVYIKAEALRNIVDFIKTEHGFEYNFLADYTATDEQTEPRFELVLNLFSTTHLWRIRVKVRVRENEEIASLVDVWPGANWAEREIFDMFGIRFSGHPNLRRILMDVRYQGHPLRKDFPLRGYQLFTDTEIVDPTLLE